jgi:hypothetical protein
MLMIIGFGARGQQKVYVERSWADGVYCAAFQFRLQIILKERTRFLSFLKLIRAAENPLLIRRL